VPELEKIVNEVLSDFKKTYELSVKRLESEAESLHLKYEKRIKELKELIVKAFTFTS
jgi:hypothetical protein